MGVYEIYVCLLLLLLLLLLLNEYSTVVYLVLSSPSTPQKTTTTTTHTHTKKPQQNNSQKTNKKQITTTTTINKNEQANKISTCYFWMSARTKSCSISWMSAVTFYAVYLFFIKQKSGKGDIFWFTDWMIDRFYTALFSLLSSGFTSF